MLKSLNHILCKLEEQPEWEGLKQFQRLVNCWRQVVGATVAQQTQPYSISRDILYVATSSSVWAQELQFKRRFILKKLNAQLTIQLVDIRFSTAQWKKNNRSNEVSELQSSSWQEHPSYLAETVSVSPIESTAAVEDPHSAYQRWVKLMQTRSQQLPWCPECQCPTPPGELQRWGICCLCAAKRWQS
ncbi:MAG: DUF721 domain-containing protein [Symploca sp. SIO2E6]|nr:DUF721 domain-containing protein [Symploca sp. SIO2E6]